MALVVICGQPCSGKSTVAAELRRQLDGYFSATTLVDEPSLHLSRNVSYASTLSSQLSHIQTEGPMPLVPSRHSCSHRQREEHKSGSEVHNGPQPHTPECGHLGLLE